MEEFQTLQTRFCNIAKKTTTKDLTRKDIEEMEQLIRKMDVAISRELSELESLR